MRRYFKYIFLTLITVIFAASCIEEMQSPQPMPQSDALTLVPRVKSFTNQYVTKAEGDEAAYTQAETKITHLAYLIFDRNGDLVKMDEADVQNGNGLTLNKTNLNSSETSATVVMFANVNLADIKKEVTGEDETTSIIKITDDEELSLEGLDDYSIYLNSDPVVLSGDLSGSGFKGFPMKGNAENVNLTTASTDPIVVNLQILYAKVSFEIGVAAGTENQNYEGVMPQFEISGYSVHNVSKITTVAELGEEDATASDDYAYTGSSSKAGSLSTSNNKVASTSGNTKVDFTFYMAESCYNHGGTSGVYPVGDLPEDVKQQYKPKLATNGTGLPSTGLATYVTINGKYKDYRGTEWTVNYKVYLGKNSYDDFHVDRNSEYKNFLTIKGIRNNDTYTDAGSVWIDHRVNVSTNDPSKHIKVTRETLIDSHIEVRPLRVDLKGSEYAAVKVILPNVNWIAAERFTGLNCQDGSVYCYGSDNKSTGKRRYFTTTLISDLKAAEGTELILLDDECAWIYFDENTDSDIRTTKISVNFLNSSGVTQKTEEFAIIQKGLLRVGSEESGYYIESYEEYLHTYDSDDKYNLTTSPFDYTQTGIEWDMEEARNMSDSLVTSATTLDLLTGIMDETLFPKFDYFHQKDDPNYGTDGSKYSLYKQNKEGAFFKLLDDNEEPDYSKQTGLYFTNRAAAKVSMTIMDMGTLPNSAYQYCLSKNKFIEDTDGDNHELDIHWYLPDSYELEAFINSQATSDLASGTNYWSSQPSWKDVVELPQGVISLINAIPGVENFTPSTIKQEDVENARAVSANGRVDLGRDEKARIRCFYSEKGIEEVSMSGDRTPNGIGGNETFYMSSSINKNKSKAGYFRSLLDNEKRLDLQKPKEQRTVVIEDDNIGKWNYTDNEYAYPTVGDIGEFNKTDYYFEATDNNGKTVKGFHVDITDSQYWTKESKPTAADWGAVYYTTLYTYPGLSPWKTDTYDVYNYYCAKELTNSPKTDKKSNVVSTTITLSKTLPSASLTNLSDKLTISFGKGDNSDTNSPKFEYDELEYRAEQEYTRFWEVEYPESEYIPISTKPDMPYSGEEKREYQSNHDDRSTAISNAYAEATRLAEDAAKAKALSNAQAANPYATVIPQDGTESYEELDYDQSVYYRYKKGYFATVEVKIKCTMKFTISSTAEPIPYYAFPTESPWHIQQVNGKDYREIDPINDQINTDELRMYCGNSLTISLRNATFMEGGKLYNYSDAYEITKVVVHYREGNRVKEELAPIRNTYARFVPQESLDNADEDGVFAEKRVTLQLTEGEALPLEGMTYSADSASGTGWHEWTGNTNSVTLNLSEYSVLDYSLGSAVIYRDYKYEKARVAKDKYIVISHIDVKCTKKPNYNQATEETN